MIKQNPQTTHDAIHNISESLDYLYARVGVKRHKQINKLSDLVYKLNKDINQDELDELIRYAEKGDC